MAGAGRLCSVQSFCTVILLELGLMLGFWVGDYLPRYLNRPPDICDVTNSSIVRKLIQKNWTPILKKHGVSLPVECPFNIARDLHGIRESVKRTRSSHWQCLKCGKKFYLERHLDLHIERRHSELINNASP
ncbi:Serendipity locus protein H-1 [Folsomia candida]|uniref:Serendipity locus protein H-1 n=1 Tax=Folsomia candida TaxID=158441 RepID=A0A226E4R5_FOLCA|nr:Serendipity locus protein H-1 [Folsomia candida]